MSTKKQIETVEVDKTTHRVEITLSVEVIFESIKNRHTEEHTTEIISLAIPLLQKQLQEMLSKNEIYANIDAGIVTIDSEY